ncbi:MAG: lipopolysaccharide heptosyltransferase II [Chthonomonas sp.]|nr:lipopolysaccharide heptosyltransferase II [Chthonomonas sp.]
MRILIVRLSAIGDCLFGSPIAEALRQSFPNAYLGWAVHPLSAPVLEGNPFLDKVHVVPRKSFFRQLPMLARELRRERYDVAMDLQGLYKSAAVALASGAPRRMGPDKSHERVQWLYKELVAMDESQHVVPRYLNFARALGATWHQEPEMLMPFGESHLAMARSLLEEAGVPISSRIITINPATSKAVKDWPQGRFALLADALQSNLKVVPIFTGSPADRDLCDEIIKEMKTPGVNLAGKTSLNELAALISLAELFIGGDTGPLHIAQAAGTRVLAIFGPTDPKLLGPRSPKHQTAYLNLECSPCRHKVCPIGHPCMENLSVESLTMTAERMLTEPKTSY